MKSRVARACSQSSGVSAFVLERSFAALCPSVLAIKILPPLSTSARDQAPWYTCATAEMGSLQRARIRARVLSPSCVVMKYCLLPTPRKVGAMATKVRLATLTYRHTHTMTSNIPLLRQREYPWAPSFNLDPVPPLMMESALLLSLATKVRLAMLAYRDICDDWRYAATQVTCISFETFLRLGNLFCCSRKCHCSRAWWLRCALPRYYVAICTMTSDMSPLRRREWSLKPSSNLGTCSVSEGNGVLLKPGD